MTNENKEFYEEQVVESKYLLENVMKVGSEHSAEKIESFLNKVPKDLLDLIPGFNLANHIHFENGFRLSVQANKHLKCFPERNFVDEADIANFSSFEVLVYNRELIEPVKEIWDRFKGFEFADSNAAMYNYVPKKLIEVTIAEADKLYKLVPKENNQ